jgi:hypothetical protein
MSEGSLVDRFQALAAGSYRIYVAKVGYKPFSTNLVLRDGETLAVIARMDPSHDS